MTEGDAGRQPAPWLCYCLERCTWPLHVAWAPSQHGGCFYRGASLAKAGRLCDLLSEVRQRPVCCILFIRSKSLRLAAI